MACIGALCDELLSWRVINKIIRFDSCDEESRQHDIFTDEGSMIGIK